MYCVLKKTKPKQGVSDYKILYALNDVHIIYIYIHIYVYMWVIDIVCPNIIIIQHVTVID